MWSNFHTHSKYCDGKGDLQDHLIAAREKKVMSLGFSSHAPLPFDCTWCMKRERLDSYLADIQTLSSSEGDIEIYAGLEVDFIPDVVSPDDFKDQLHYTIGSIHFVDEIPGGKRWEIDSGHTTFLEGLDKIFNNDFREALIRYFDLTRAMIRDSPPDIIGHMDKIKIQNINDKFFNESDAWYKDEIHKTLNLIKGSGVIVEVNTRGIYKKKSATTYPSPWILQRIYELNIPITLNSDAHHSDNLINEFEPTAFMLKDIGFKNLTILKDGLWKSIPFDQYGINCSKG
jgi:histidinol-phosphatase (PHP family)